MVEDTEKEKAAAKFAIANNNLKREVPRYVHNPGLYLGFLEGHDWAIREKLKEEKAWRDCVVEDFKEHGREIKWLKAEVVMIQIVIAILQLTLIFLNWRS